MDDGSGNGSGAGAAGGAASQYGDAILSGAVVAPQGTIPVARALVYVTKVKPVPIPSGVYCDRCVELPDGTPHAFTEIDGTFEFVAPASGDAYLVVQKGQFRRVRAIKLEEGTNLVPLEFTRLPGQPNSGLGDSVPKIAISEGDFDDIQISLGKLGVLTFDLIDEYTIPTTEYLLGDLDTLNDYHILFLPCTGPCANPYADSPKVQSNLRDFVRAGGKVYVTDYSYEFVRRTWPGFYNWEFEDADSGSACGSSYDAPAAVNDESLKDWLGVMSITNFQILKNYTRILQTNPADVTDLNGKLVTVSPTTWISALDQGVSSATVSFQDGCGRVLFSTYHTEGDPDSPQLLPQELALLYVLLEVGLCVDDPIVH